jgi:hypothetical protein
MSQYAGLGHRIISLLERLHTLALLILAFGWELYHFWRLLFR